VVKLFFSLDKHFTAKTLCGLSMMKPPLHLRTLKDSGGNYLWNHSDNTILGKPVEYSPTICQASRVAVKPIAFGDFSFLWIVDRQPLSVKVLEGEVHS
jgi:HK97 family phage major capsid protein